jgi:hypothetical protein
MNERIKELAKQSGAMFDHMTWVERDLAPVFERFSELIVRECACLCSMSAPGRDAEDIEEAILKHFGVKE